MQSDSYRGSLIRSQLGSHILNIKALTYSDIKAFLFDLTVTLLKQLHDYSYLNFRLQVPGIIFNEGFWD